MKRRKLLFLATEDWFVRSHFLPLVRRAVAEDFEVVVWARESGALAAEPGIRLIKADFDRLTKWPWDLHRQSNALRRVLAGESPDVIHAIALKPILLLLQSGYKASGRILALTGRGFLAADAQPWKQIVSAHIRRTVQRAIDEPKTVALVENGQDGRWITTGETSERILLMPGAGVDPDVFTPSPEPVQGAIVGILSRLIRSKGIDLAVNAISQLRAQHVDVSLAIGGAADPQNPDCYSETEIERWRATPGVELLGRVDDVPAFWRGVHIACLPSRGGEGLPRTLLEAASCGRPIVTSDAPGCVDFVGGDEIGLVAVRNDVSTLADALERLASDADLRRRMGEAARAKILAGYTETHAAAVAARAWKAVLPA
jgi:glycosyltransferase involved in cell wall biosynthesis